MKRYETRILAADEAQGFIDNMRWFVGMGRISWKKLGRGLWRVRATRTAWSYWVTPKA